MIPKLYTPKEAGQRLGVSKDTIRRLVEAGDLAGTTIGRGSIRPVLRISEDSLKAFIEERTNVA